MRQWNLLHADLLGGSTGGSGGGGRGGSGGGGGNPTATPVVVDTIKPEPEMTAQNAFQKLSDAAKKAKTAAEKLKKSAK